MKTEEIFQNLIDNCEIPVIQKKLKFWAGLFYDKYYSKKYPNGYIEIDTNLTLLHKVIIFLHEYGHYRYFNKNCKYVINECNSEFHAMLYSLRMLLKNKHNKELCYFLSYTMGYYFFAKAAVNNLIKMDVNNNKIMALHLTAALKIIKSKEWKKCIDYLKNNCPKELQQRINFSQKDSMIQHIQGITLEKALENMKIDKDFLKKIKEYNEKNQ